MKKREHLFFLDHKLKKSAINCEQVIVQRVVSLFFQLKFNKWTRRLCKEHVGRKVNKARAVNLRWNFCLCTNSLLLPQSNNLPWAHDPINSVFLSAIPTSSTRKKTFQDTYLQTDWAFSVVEHDGKSKVSPLAFTFPPSSDRSSSGRSPKKTTPSAFTRRKIFWI